MSDDGEEFNEDEEKIYFAITGDDVCTLKRLLNDGVVNPNFKFFGSNQMDKSALHLSCETGNIECAKTLLDYGCDCDPEDTFEQTPLFYSIFSERTNMVNLLLRSGANPNHRDRFGKTAVHFAVNNSSCEILQMLIDVCANLNQRDEKGRAPIWTAVSEDGHLDQVKCLIAAGCDVDMKDLRERRTALQVAILNSSKDTMAYVSVLLEAGASCNTTDQFGHTPMMTLIRRGRRKDKTFVQEDDLKIAKLLLEKGYIVDTVSVASYWYQFHGTALKMAADRGAAPLVAVLLDAGADADLTDDKSITPLLLAAFNNFLDIAKLLIMTNCQLNIKGEVKIERTAVTVTPFRCAMLQGHFEMAKLLVLAGFNLNTEHYISAIIENIMVVTANGSDLPKIEIDENCSFCGWLQKEKENAWSLANVARHFIRKSIGKPFAAKLEQLPLPRWTKDYIMMKELLL